MRRSELETKLRKLGWEPTGPSGERHTAWRHPSQRGVIAVPNTDLITDVTAERLIAQAGG